MMQKKAVFQTLSSPNAAVGDASTSGSYPAKEANNRYPSRFRTPAVSGPGAKASDKHSDFQIQHLKTLNADLQAKLRLKTAENSQLKLELAKIKSEHDKDIREVQLRQKKSVEMMSRTLKHAEDVIKQKEQLLGKQQEMIGKISALKAARVPGADLQAAPGFGVRKPWFHGRTELSRGKTPALPFSRSASVRSAPGTSTTPVSATRIAKKELVPNIQREQEKVIAAPGTACPPMQYILDLSQKSRVLQNVHENCGDEYEFSEKAESYTKEITALRRQISDLTTAKEAADADKIYYQSLYENARSLRTGEWANSMPANDPSVLEEVRKLRLVVNSLTLECQSTKRERDEYYAKSANLESIVKCMREAAEKRKELELEYQEAKEQLREKQSEIKQLHKNEVVGKRKHQEVIESLESKLRELEKKCELQAVRFEELSLEMTSVQRQASRSRSLANMTTSEVQTSPESGTSTPDSALSSSVKMVNGECSRPPPSVAPKPRLGHQKGDSGLGSSLDESVSSRKDSSASYSSSRTRQILHPLSESVDRAVDANQLAGDQNPKLSVFIAKFAYIPAKQSPNLDIRDSELELKKGEYVIVFGDMDEDGYYEGETLEGRRGLVPSNYVDRLPPEELVDFHASYPNNPALHSTGGAPNQRVQSDYHHQHHHHHLQSAPPSTVRFAAVPLASLSYSGPPVRGPVFAGDLRPDLVTGQQQQQLVTTRPSDFSQKLPSSSNNSSATREPAGVSSEDPSVPPPANLALEKQMHKSIMISWSAAPVPAGFVESYNVYVNRERKTSVRANERCRALVEGIDLSSCHRVSVRTCTGAGRESLDSLCTILVGKDCPVQPSDVRVINITANSATVTWIPANTNYQHSIFVNEKEYAIVPPSTYRFVIPDLVSSTEYRVHVVPIVPKSTINYSTYLHACAQVGFKTLPDNVPDPPATLQLESGPQDGTLLLTWTPVVPQRNCDVIGYAIYADGQKVQQIDSPTGDHALLDITRFQSAQLPRNLTVRTISSKNLSRDSPFLSVTEDVLLGQIKAVAQVQSDPPYSQPQQQSLLQQQQPQPGLNSGPLNRQNTVTFRDPPQQRPMMPLQQQQPPPPLQPPSRPPTNQQGEFYISGDDVLTDILEEAEEEAIMEMKRPMFDTFGRRIPQQPRSAIRNPNRPFSRNPREMEFGGGGGPPPQLNGPRFASSEYARWNQQQQQQQNPYPSFGPGPQLMDGRGFPARGPMGPGMRDPRQHDPNMRRPGPYGLEPYRGFYEDDYHHGDPTRHMQNSFAMHERTSSLPQIEITKDDSFESMDSRHRAFSDREADERGHGGRGMRSRYNSPPNDSAYRRQRSQSRDRFDDSSRNRSQERYSGYIGNDGRDRGQGDRRQSRSTREIPAGRYEYPDEQPSGSRMHNNLDAVDPRRMHAGTYSAGGTLERIKSKLVRLFRTNVDWNAATDSPNTDAASEELSFKKNEFVKITGHKDADGYYNGELLNSGRRGLVPCNLVDKVDDEHAIRKYLGDEAVAQKAARPSAMKGQRGPSNTLQNSISITDPPRKNSAVRRMIAKYDYNASESPNADFEKELSFSKGDVIFVSGMDDDGFYEGELNGKRGLVPSNFLLDPAVESTGGPVSDQPPAMLTRVPSIREPGQPPTSRAPSSAGPSGPRQPNLSAQPSRSALQTTTAEMHNPMQPKR